MISIIVLLSFLSRTLAANDWSTPCFNGVCSYESNLASVKIWGSVNAISDITTAGGWTILNCDPNSLSQDIRIVCHDTSSCNYLLQGVGAVGKLVRLPENCGASAFARVGRIWVDQDQSIPPSVAKTLRRRSATRRAANPQVQGVSLDTNFSAIDPQQSGNVSIAIQGSNVPGATGNLTVTPASQRRSRLSDRGLGDFVESAFDKFNNFDPSVTQQLPPIDVDKTFPIFSQSISCPASGNIPAFDASVKADVVTKAHAVITLGVAASGTLVPPSLNQIGIYTALDATLDGTLELSGDATATADSGSITLFETGIPGLSLPGILTLGPSFKILGQATATLDIGVDMSVDLSYNINNAKLFFPSSQDHQSGGDFAPGDSPLKLSVTPSLASKGVVEAHLIPTIDLGISALDDTASANVFLNLDASASVTLTLDASTEVDTPLSSGSNSNSTDDDSASSQMNTTISDSVASNSTAVDGGDDSVTSNSTSVDDGDDSASQTNGTATDTGDNTEDDSSDTDNDQSDDADGPSATDTDDDDQSDDTDDDSTSDPSDSANTDDGSNDDSGADTSDNSGLDDNNTDTSDDGEGDDSTDSGDGLDDNNDQSTDTDNDSDDDDDDSEDTSTADGSDTGDDSTDSTDGGSDDGSEGGSDDDSFFVRRTDGTGSVSGCFDVGAALSVNAGADASFFGLFDKNTQVSLFQKNFDLFKKCLGNGDTRRRDMEGLSKLVKRIDLSCPSADLANLVSIADEPVPASSIQAER